MTDYLTVDQVAVALGLDTDAARLRIRERGPAGVVRTDDGRLLVPSEALDQLRDRPRRLTPEQAAEGKGPGDRRAG